MSPTDAFRIGYFLQIIDYISESTKERFEQMKSFINDFGILFKISSIRDLDRSVVLHKCRRLTTALKYDDIGDVDGEELCDELTVLSLNVPKEASAHEVLKYLVSHRLAESYVNSTLVPQR